MKRKFFTGIIVAGFCLLFLSLSYGTSADTIVNATIAEPDSLDPHFDYEVSGQEVLVNMYDMLIEYDGASVKNFKPRLALEVPTVANAGIKDGGKTYVFKIRPGVKFWNGDDLTAKDVEYSFKRAIISSPENSPIWMLFKAFYNSDSLETLVGDYVGKPWKDIFDDKGNPKAEYVDKLNNFYKDVIDPIATVSGDTVTFHLKKVFLPFLNVVCQYASWAAVLDMKWSVQQKNMWDGTQKEWWKTHNLKKEDSPLYAAAMGSGPYKLVTWDRGQKKVILERNDSYWRAPANIKNVIIQTVEEWSTRKAMMQKGDADILQVIETYLDQLKDIKGAVINTGIPTLSLDAASMVWNVKPESKYIGSGKLDGDGIPPDFFADKNIRLGFIYSYDAATYTKDVTHGLSIPIASCLPNTLLGYSDSVPKYKFDLNKAASYFKQAYKGKLWSVGFKMILLYNNGNDRRQKFAEMIRDNLAKINPKFQVEVHGVDWPTYQDARKNHVMPFYVIGWVADFPDPDNFIYTYYDSNGDYGSITGEDYAKYTAVKRPELGGLTLDQAIEQAAATLDNAKRADLYIKVQKIVNADGVNLPMAQQIGINMISAKVKGFVSNPMLIYYCFEYYKLSKTK